MVRQTVFSWGRVLRTDCEVLPLYRSSAAIPSLPGGNGSLLPFGNGRSYGDSCLNPGGSLLYTRHLDHFMAFDRTTGVLRCEAGVLLAAILELVVPQGWILPVTPGTRFVTVGGAIANDVHGKNHQTHGTFGRHVRQFLLRRSEGQELYCSPRENADWFSATIGGLGLTGLVVWAELQLRPIAGPWMQAQTLPFGDLDGFFDLCEDSADAYEYTVAWIDCAGTGKRLGRGLFTRANHVQDGYVPQLRTQKARFRELPSMPLSLVNKLTVSMFNTLHFHLSKRRTETEVQHYESFFYPLDRVLHWNRIYGPRGFYQYQCVVPPDDARAVVTALLTDIARQGTGSFLAVLKQFGNLSSPGLMSFPRQGVTLALDFPNVGAELHALFARLDALVTEAEGRLYPAKDGRMPGECFRAGYPEWRRFSAFIDPAFSSGFWRRVTEDV